MGGAGGRGGGPLLMRAGSSPSQVGIHHGSGGHLYSDSFVNVNYCSLSGVLSAQGGVPAGALASPWLYREEAPEYLPCRGLALPQVTV
ncbi:unnamed protein product [Lota lota]